MDKRTRGPLLHKVGEPRALENLKKEIDKVCSSRDFDEWLNRQIVTKMDDVKEKITAIMDKYDIYETSTNLCMSLKKIYTTVNTYPDQTPPDLYKEVHDALQLFYKQDPNARRMSTPRTRTRPTTPLTRGRRASDLQLPEDAGFA
jgi:hypothetical protein